MPCITQANIATATGDHPTGMLGASLLAYFIPFVSFNQYQLIIALVQEVKLADYCRGFCVLKFKTSNFDVQSSFIWPQSY